MSNNYTINGITFASNEIAGVEYARVKIAAGDDGAAQDVSPAHPMPVAVQPKTLLTLCGTVSASGSTVILAHDNVSNFTLYDCTLQNETSTPVTIQLQIGGVEIERVRAANDGDGLSKVYPLDGRPGSGASTADLSINLTNAVQVGYSIHFFRD